MRFFAAASVAATFFFFFGIVHFQTIFGLFGCFFPFSLLFVLFFDHLFFCSQQYLGHADNTAINAVRE